MTTKPTFLPRDGSPTINVNIRTEKVKKKKKLSNKHNGTNSDDDDDFEDDVVARMWRDQINIQQPDDGDSAASESREQGEEEMTKNICDKDETSTPLVSTDDGIAAVTSETRTTIEYDVVKCADFVLDEGCWVRNMPDEIRRVNPEFVPT